MHFENIHQLLEDRRFKAIIRKKQRLPVLFSLAIIVLFFGFILFIAFAPSVISVKLVSDGAITLYLVLSAGLIILVCILMNIFITIKNRDEHEDIYELMEILREDQE